MNFAQPSLSTEREDHAPAEEHVTHPKANRMTFHITTRWGSDESAPSIERMQEVLSELKYDDIEHQSVALTHETEWCIGAYQGGLVVFENLEEGEPRHMNNVSEDKIIELWLKLSEGKIAEIEKEPWLPGYEDV